MYPLEGLKVVDFGIWLAGPFAGRLLGDLGASVIKVEAPEGEPTRPRSDEFIPNMLYSYANRGRNIAIDLKQPAGLAIAQKLIAGADVVMQNQRVGVADRLGIGYEDARRINPGVIYCFSPGFGAFGPRAHFPSFEPLNSAFVGMHHRSAGEGNPPVQSISLDAFCALMAANGILMALLHREQTGQGQYLDVSQLACAMYYTSDTYRMDDGTLGPLPQLDHEQLGLGPLNRSYQTSDDWLTICCEQDHEWAALCAALDVPDLRKNPCFRTAHDRDTHGKELGATLAEVFLRRPSREWCELLNQHGAPCEIPAQGGEPSLQNPAYVASGLVIEGNHPVWGRTREPRVVPVFSDTPARTLSPTLCLGEHTREILEELGYGGEEIAQLERAGVVVAA